MIDIFADCSYWNKKTAVAVFDTLRCEFMMSKFFPSYDSLSGEVGATLLALKRARTIFSMTNEREITIYTDCFSIARYMNGEYEIRPTKFNHPTRKRIGHVVNFKRHLETSFDAKINIFYINRKNSEAMRVVDIVAYRHFKGQKIDRRKSVTFGSFKDYPFAYVPIF